MSTTLRNVSNPQEDCRKLNPAIRTAIVGSLLIAANAAPSHSEAIGLNAASEAHQLHIVVVHAVEEASRRFDVSAAWVRAVLRAESDGDAHSVSKKGAIGLMQLMPNTYAELRAKLGLGSDPFDPRDNILAGAFYLSEMLNRYGEKGFLAAYNAGPRRYEDYLLRGRPLPAETTDYGARLAPQIDLVARKDALTDARHRSIFVKSAARNLSNDLSPIRATKQSDPHRQAAPHTLFSASSPSKICAASSETFGGQRSPTGATHAQPSDLFVARISSKETP